MRPLCVYHGGCDDGFAAAWVVRQALGADGVEFHPGVYGRDPPAVAGRDVILVDFSYKRPVLDAMAKTANSILVLDHRITAQEDLAGISRPCSAESWREYTHYWRDGDFAKDNGAAVRALFDMERSGAALAWDYFIGDGRIGGWTISEARHRRGFIDYIQDRDLWRKTLPNGDEFTIALRSYEQTFETWSYLIERGPAALIDERAWHSAVLPPPR
jgi:hypothetical protein